MNSLLIQCSWIATWEIAFFKECSLYFPQTIPVQ